ncbi:MAG: HAMP domain-containing protein [Gammaproteobacteria bacterium]|nr:HAMP domain-containing protein [Gammaproteobacteria bacterium]MCZ6578826.1 HAMP domain-containing protein [Gammaproteobacteria bacterium]MCZ6796758.1 HAMP domain-containing protein [Gammaproteobacteria bacterium]
MKKRSYFQSLRGKITNRILFIGIVPILVIGSIGWFSLDQLTTEVSSKLNVTQTDLLDRVVGANLITVSNRLAEQLDTFMLERISDVVTWVSAPIVVEAAKAAAALHNREGLTTLDIDAVEAKFITRKSLNVSPKANSYLKAQIGRSKHFGEAFFTDRNGFNVALTNPTSDFVQRDENWWKSAWENGISVGEVEYDESASIWSVDISVRIDDARTGRSLGVMKAVLGVSLIQQVADSGVEGIEGGSVTVINGDGQLLAETSTRHALDRIMNESVNFRKSSDAAIKTAFGSQPSGYVIGEQKVMGFAHSAGAELYKSVVDRFQGFNWVVVVQQSTEVALAPIRGLASIQSSLATSKQNIVYVLGTIVIVVFILAIVMAGILSSRIISPLLELREHAEAVSKGGTSHKINISSNDEIEDLAVAFQRLLTSLTIIVKRYKVLKSKVGSG